MWTNLLSLFDDCPDTDRQLRDLAAMDDHQLADLGIARDQIEAFVSGRASR